MNELDIKNPIELDAASILGSDAIDTKLLIKPTEETIEGQDSKGRRRSSVLMKRLSFDFGKQRKESFVAGQLTRQEMKTNFEEETNNINTNEIIISNEQENTNSNPVEDQLTDLYISPMVLSDLDGYEFPQTHRVSHVIHEVKEIESPKTGKESWPSSCDDAIIQSSNDIQSVEFPKSMDNIVPTCSLVNEPQSDGIESEESFPTSTPVNNSNNLGVQRKSSQGAIKGYMANLKTTMKERRKSISSSSSSTVRSYVTVKGIDPNIKSEELPEVDSAKLEIKTNIPLSSSPNSPAKGRRRAESLSASNQPKSILTTKTTSNSLDKTNYDHLKTPATPTVNISPMSPRHPLNKRVSFSGTAEVIEEVKNTSQMAKLVNTVKDFMKTAT
ncbi:hypothetical protein BC833DRAFT_608604 [Globomyces pollinis-pini]|nr:hypothetical protein BC833DRAFT_608604 [Globomyces pollinis-pini]